MDWARPISAAITGVKQIPQQLELLDSCQANQGSGISQ
jgi:hypothetical protein